MSPLSLRAADLAERLQGRILLQAESNGEAWYVDPINRQRVYLGRPDDVFRVMRDFGLGIKQAELSSYLRDGFPKRLAGRILLDVEGRGEAYYVSPDDLRGRFLGSPGQAFQVIREKAVGITNSDISRIKVLEKKSENIASIDRMPEQANLGNSQAAHEENRPDHASGRPDESSRPETPANPEPGAVNTPAACSAWTYSSWGDCSNGVKTRQVLSALPENCQGGSPEITKPCENSVCTSWRYTEWHNCHAGFQLREVAESFPAGCVGGNPVILKSCSSNVTCNAWTYSDWGPCLNGSQSRSALVSFPDGCSGGEPVLSQSCEASVASPYSAYQFRYVREFNSSNEVRILVLSEPNENIKIIKLPITAYYSHSFNDPLPSDLTYSVNYIDSGEQKSIDMIRLNNTEYLFEAGEPIPLNLGDSNSLTIRANKSGYGAINDTSKWVIWDYSVNKPVWTGR